MRTEPLLSKQDQKMLKEIERLMEIGRNSEENHPAVYLTQEEGDFYDRYMLKKYPPPPDRTWPDGTLRQDDIPF